MSKRIIHVGGVFKNPQLNREGAAASEFKPGTIVHFVNGKATPSATGTEAAIHYVANMDYLRCKGVDDAYKAGDWVVCIHPFSGVFLNVRAAAGTYKKGQPLAVADGKVKAAGASDVATMFVEEDSITVEDGELLRVVIK